MQAEIDSLQAKLDEATQLLDEYTEEHVVEEGLLEEAMADKGKVTKSGATGRLRQLTMENGQWIAEDQEEAEALEECLERIDNESEAKKAVREAQEQLDAAVLNRYSSLSEAEIKTLTVKDKWFASIAAAIEGEVQRLTGQLASRVKELEERYALLLPEQEVELFSSKVQGYLAKMGLAI